MFVSYIYEQNSMFKYKTKESTSLLLYTSIRCIHVYPILLRYTLMLIFALFLMEAYSREYISMFM